MKNVKIYTTSDCSKCQQAKDYLKDKDVSLEEIDLGKNDQKGAELIQKTGFSALPQIEIDGKYIIGYDPKKIDELLES